MGMSPVAPWVAPGVGLGAGPGAAPGWSLGDCRGGMRERKYETTTGRPENQTIYIVRASQITVTWVPGPSIYALRGRLTANIYCHCESMLFLRMIAWICVVLLVCFRAPAQTGQGSRTSEPTFTPQGEQAFTSYEGQNVSSIQIAGRPEPATSQYEHLFIQQAGQPFSQDNVEKTAAALKLAGHFDDVRIQIVPESNGVRVLLIIEPAVYLGIFEFPGAQQFPYAQLIQQVNYPIQSAINPEEMNTDNQALIAFFQQEGYFRAQSKPQIDFDAAHAIANVRFETTLGKQAKFGTTVIEGAPPGEQAELEHKLTRIPARLRGAAIRPGKTYHHSTLTKADQYLQNSMEKKGYLNAQVKLSGAEYDNSDNRANIHFQVQPGPLTHVDISGAHLWSWTKKSLLPVYQGVGVDDETVLEGEQALVSYFQTKGYFDVKVDSQLKKESNADTVVYKITKEKKHKVKAVALSGNSKVNASELTPQLAVEKKHLFSPGKFSDQLVQKSVSNLRAVYTSEGFSSVQVNSSVVRKEGNVYVTFRVVEGPRDVVNSLSIEGADTFPQSQFAPNGLKLAAGQPYSQAHVQADRASIVANYLQAGYLMASFRETASEISKSNSHRINVVYHIYEGPRVMAGQVLTLGRYRTNQRLIDQDLKEIKPGKPLTESELLTAGSKLYDHTGVFDWAEVDPKEPITTQKSDDVLVKVHEAKRNDLTYGFGFEVIQRGGNIPSGTVALPNLPPLGLPANFSTSEATFYGPRGTIQFTRNNLRGKGESISLTGFAGRLDQRVAAYYIDPNFRWTSWKSTTSFSVERNEENPIFSSQQEQGSFQIQKAIDRTKKDIFFLQYAFSKVDLTRVLIAGLVPDRDLHVRLSTFSANLTRDTRDNPLDEHRGVLRSLELDFNTTKLGSSVNFAKLTGQAAFYKEKIHHIVWAESVRVGLAQPFAGSFVPLSEAYFSGGGSSLRGLPLDSAGPQRFVSVCNASGSCQLLAVPAGGNELLILNSEARIPLPIKKGLGVVAFYDGGGVFPYVGFHDFGSELAPFSHNVGLGLRYATPVGPIRVDIGWNLNPPPNSTPMQQGTNVAPPTRVSPIQYFVSIGQAF